MGKPEDDDRRCDAFGVYPHKRGETEDWATLAVRVWGLSPQAWGNLKQIPGYIGSSGSIPTSVGKPLIYNLMKTHNKIIFCIFNALVDLLRNYLIDRRTKSMAL